MRQSVDERCLAIYIESFRDEAKHVLIELDKVPAAAWTERDFDKHTWAINTLNQTNKQNKVTHYDRPNQQAQ